MIEIGYLNIATVATLPFTREKMRAAMISAGIGQVPAGKAISIFSQQIRPLIPAIVKVHIDHAKLRITAKSETNSPGGSFEELFDLPSALPDERMTRAKEILGRLNREELLQDLDRQVNERTAELNAERRKSESLLRNMLPAPIAMRLKDGHRVADRRIATVMFIDLVGFSSWSSDMEPTVLLEKLDTIFAQIDIVTKQFGLEKIKTIGDCYMAAAGIPLPQADHADRVVQAALEIIKAIPLIKEKVDMPIAMRVGIHCGPVVAGVIGTDKAFYDIWGNTVNVASRLESYGQPGKVHISDQVRQLLSKEYRLEDRGVTLMKNVGDIRSWFVELITPH